MQLSPAFLTIVHTLAMFFAAVIGAIAMDWLLWKAGDETLSHWLRAHPLWFLIPAGLLLGAAVALFVHLAFFGGGFKNG